VCNVRARMDTDTNAQNGKSRRCAQHKEAEDIDLKNVHLRCAHILPNGRRCSTQAFFGASSDSPLSNPLSSSSIFLLPLASSSSLSQPLLSSSAPRLQTGSSDILGGQAPETSAVNQVRNAAPSRMQTLVMCKKNKNKNKINKICTFRDSMCRLWYSGVLCARSCLLHAWHASWHHTCPVSLPTGPLNR